MATQPTFLQASPAPLPSPADLRGAPRFSLLIRAAKLVSEQGEFLCVVRDVSETGVRLKLFHPLPAQARLALELGNGEIYFIEKVWEDGDHAGFRFSAPIDVAAFIAEPETRPRKEVRLSLRARARLDAGPLIEMVTLTSLSQHGAGFEAQSHLAVGELIKLTCPGMPALIGTVAWRSSPGYGVVFQSYVGMAELARMAAALQTGESAPIPA
ncbi:MAG TPA: PilZ domain-containing protein [Novosphingobium sp.]|nr:PilZ domain-containing protein [Novosphingobium sp.]HMP56529.1 PilZ domain-containing protein [Novosphingobium sp.]